MSAFVPLIDKVKEYWDARPCNINHSDKPVGTEEYFREVDARKRLVEPHIDWFANYNAWKGKRVLEVGCGIGTDTERFVRAGAIVTAIDLSSESFHLTSQRLKLTGLKATLINGNAEDLSRLLKGFSAKVEPFDLVYSFGVIHHSPNPGKILEEMRKLAHDDTLCKIMVYNRFSWKTLKLTKGRMWRNDLVALQSEAESNCPITYTYSLGQISDLLYDKGWEISSYAKDHIFPYKIEPYKNYQYEKTFFAEHCPTFFHFAERHWGWHLMVEAIPC